MDQSSSPQRSPKILQKTQGWELLHLRGNFLRCFSEIYAWRYIRKTKYKLLTSGSWKGTNLVLEHPTYKDKSKKLLGNLNMNEHRIRFLIGWIHFGAQVKSWTTRKQISYRHGKWSISVSMFIADGWVSKRTVNLITYSRDDNQK